MVIIDSALNKRLVTKEELFAAAKRLRRPDIDKTIVEADSSARSGMETLGRIELRKIPGLEVKCGVVIEGVGEVDLLINGRLIVELDGYEYHQSKKEFYNDRARSRAAMLLGYDTMRFTFEDVTNKGYLGAQICDYFRTKRA